MSSDRGDLRNFDGTNLDALPRWLRDLIDLGNESAGRDTGRARRFYLSEEHDPQGAEKKREKERAFNALLLRLQDPNYARLYAEAAENVTRAGNAVETALREIARETDAVRQRLERIRETAARLPDGTRIYRSGVDGKLYAEDGRSVNSAGLSADDLDAAPSWEEYTGAKRSLDMLETERRGIEIYKRDILEPAKERLGDTESPPAEEELEFFKKLEAPMPTRARKEFDRQKAEDAGLKPEASADEQGSAALNAPDLRTEFKAALDSPPAFSAASTPPNGYKRG